MPRQPRPLPVRLGRFNYWQYTCAQPPTDPRALSSERIAHEEMLKTFRQIRHGVDTPRTQRHRRRFESELNRRGISEPTPAIVALAYYLTTDRLSSQNSGAQTLLAQQSPEVQALLRSWATDVWLRRTPARWDRLLRTIARDQTLFQEIHALGPTQAGLVDSRRHDVSPIWTKYRVPKAVAQQVYREYRVEMSALLGRGRRVSEKVRAFRDQGREVPRIRPTPLMPDLAGRPADEQAAIIFHWFAHALRNLARYRDGHPPLPWHPMTCRTRCLQVRHRLMT
jgi:hypothetical protein